MGTFDNASLLKKICCSIITIYIVINIIFSSLSQVLHCPYIVTRTFTQVLHCPYIVSRTFTQVLHCPYKGHLHKSFQYLFQLSHGKTYGKVEEAFRLKVFAENKHAIAKHNQLFSQGLRSFTMKMNHFGDLVSDRNSVKSVN